MKAANNMGRPRRATGEVLCEYVWLGDLPIAMIDASSGPAQTYFNPSHR